MEDAFDMLWKARLTYAAPDWASGGDFNCSALEKVMNGDRHSPDPRGR